MERPRVKAVHNPIRLNRTLISLGGSQYGVAAELTDDAEGTVWRLLQLMDGSRTRAGIVDALAGERPHVDRASIGEAIDGIVGAGHAEDAAAATPAVLSADEVARYERAAAYFAWVDTQPRAGRFAAQALLKAARVVVCGLGGSGTAVAASLVAAGVGTVHCVDFDTIEAGNLTRQLLYTEDDLGRSKVSTAVARLRRLNRYAVVTGEECRVGGPEDVRRLMRGAGLFVLCADTPPGDVQRWTNEAALSTGTPWQVALYSGPMAITGLWVPGVVEGCLACLPAGDALLTRLYGGPPLDRLVATPPHAVLAPTANLTGHLAALEAVYFLAGLRPTSLGRMYYQSLTDLTLTYLVDPADEPDCGTCGRKARP